MTDREQTQHFANDISNLIDRYRDEYDIPVVCILGVLQCVTATLLKEADEDDED